MAKPRVSVVIPAYNESATICEVINECRQFCDEIIIVDDGSINDTVKIAKNKSATVICHEKNLGVTKTTQNGIRATHGDICAREREK